MLNRISEWMPSRARDPSRVPLRLVKAPERDTLPKGEGCLFTSSGLPIHFETGHAWHKLNNFLLDSWA